MIRKLALASVVLVAAIASAAVTGMQGQSDTAVTDQFETRTFLNPTMNGAGIDVRYAAHMQANPRFTANRFCMDHGYSQVTDYGVRTAGTTVTLGDQHRQQGHGADLDEFSHIQCGFASSFG